MKNEIKPEAIPIIDTTQLEDELLLKGRIPVASFIANAHKFFHINRLEDYFRIIDFPLSSELQPRRMTVYSFIFLTKGISSRSKGLDNYEFSENTFFFVPAHQITTHQFIRKDVEGFYCHFHLELLTDDANNRNIFNEFSFLEFNSYPLVKISDQALKYVLPLLERLLIEYKADKNFRMDIFKTYLITLFTELKPFVENQISSLSNAASIITEQYKKALSQHIYQKQKITDYSELLSISPNHLNKCVKKAMGKSAHDLMNEMLLLESKVLLKQTHLTVSEIAYKIGKNEISDFARFFKSQTGMTPTEYRTFQ